MATNERKISQHFRFLSIIVSFVLFILITGLGLYYVYSVKRESAYNIAKMAEGLLRVNRYREAVNALSNVKTGSFDAVGYYDRDDKRIFILPPTLGPDYFETEKGFFYKIMKTNISIDIFFDETNHDKAGTIIFTYNHVHAAKVLLLFYVIGVALILPVLHRFKRLIRKGVERDLLEEKNKAIQETVKQVRHDITQPLQLLYVLVKKGRGMEPDVKDKIESACDDMLSIVDDLKEKGDGLNSSQVTSICLAATLKEISEKENVKFSFENKSVKLTIEQNAIESFSEINEMELKRIMSNLIDNSARSSRIGQEIEIILLQTDSTNVIRVIDHGEGIKPEHLALVGKRGVSFRKNGNGLGISHAIERIEHWGGKFNISSIYGTETTVEILLPKVSIPAWFTGKIELKKVSEFILTDDRPVIHTLVKERLDKVNKDMKQFFHLSSSSFDSWYSEQKKELTSPVFIFDYDLGEERITGLDLIQRFNLSSKSVLMTNYYDDPVVQAQAVSANVKIFPKALIEYLGVI
ncbi:MAG: sensor histidine kinase [Bacteriovoracaceae bacterium]